MTMENGRAFGMHEQGGQGIQRIGYRQGKTFFPKRLTLLDSCVKLTVLQSNHDAAQALPLGIRSFNTAE